MRIARAELDVAERIGAGAQGVIYRTRRGERLGLPFSTLIYKEFSSRTAVSGAALEALTRVRDDATDEERRVFDAMTVWPCAVVEDERQVVGYLMQEIPPWFFQAIRTTEGGETIVREAQQLFVSDHLARKTLGEVPNRLERLGIARELAFVLGFLHKRDLVFGDLSYKNEVYALRPRPAVMLLDCDAVRVRGQGSAVPQLNSPGWGAPEHGPQTVESDRYKLGLFILRVLTPGVNAQNRDPAKADGVLDREGRELLRAALSAEPADRPSGGTWVAYLDDAIDRAGGITQRVGPAPPPPPPNIRRTPVNALGVSRSGAPMVASPRNPFGQPGGAGAPGGARVTAPTGGGVHVRPGAVATVGAPTGPAYPTPGTVGPSPPPALPTGQAWNRTQWTVVGLVALVVLAFVGLTMNAAIDRTVRGTTSPSTVPRVVSTASTVPPTAAPSGVGAAVESAQALVGPEWTAVSVGAGVGSDGRTRLSSPPTELVVSFVPAGSTSFAGSARVRRVSVRDGDVRVLPDGTATTQGALVAVPLPVDVGARADAATATAITPSRAATGASYQWLCPPVPPPGEPEVDACRWLFRFDRAAGTIEEVLVSADGRSIQTGPRTWVSPFDVGG